MLPNLSNHVDFPPFSIGTYPMELFMVVTTSNSESVVSTFKCLMVNKNNLFFLIDPNTLSTHVFLFLIHVEGIKGA